MRFFGNSGAAPGAAALVLAAALAGCSGHTLAGADAQRLIEASAGFQAPNVLHVRSRYCAPANTADTPAYGLAQLLALEGTGAIHIEHRPAAANECTSLPGKDREVLLISLTDVGGTFHPDILDRGAGWNFLLARRHFIGVTETTFNDADEPTIAHVLYRWAWRAELIGQLMQLSETPLNAQASFTRRDGEWKLRDPGV